jgi:hypothetical protein
LPSISFVISFLRPALLGFLAYFSSCLYCFLFSVSNIGMTVGAFIQEKAAGTDDITGVASTISFSY